MCKYRGLGTCAAEFAGQDYCSFPSAAAAAALSPDHPQVGGDLFVIHATVKDTPSPTSRQGTDNR